MKNQTLTTADLQLIQEILHHHITILQITSKNPNLNDSYIQLEETKKRVINTLLQSYDND